MSDKPKQRKRRSGVYEQQTDAKIEIGARLRIARELARLEQVGAAQSLGYTQGVHLSQVEAGKRAPSTDLLVRCARLYGTTTDYLLGIVDDSDRDPASALQAHMVARMSAELQRITTVMVRLSTEVVRDIVPGVLDCRRLASAISEVASAYTRVKALNPDWDETIRAGDRLEAKIGSAMELATAFSARADRAAKAMAVRTYTSAAQPGEQVQLIPVLHAALRGEIETGRGPEARSPR
jgi:transcriptional regulator with XRE-family HTH domain